MSATVEIDTGHVSDALVIPVEALSVADGRQSCYVVTDDGLERRPVQTRRATRDLVEVTDGLQEGERVVSRSVEVDESVLADKIHDHDRGLANSNRQMADLRAIDGTFIPASQCENAKRLLLAVDDDRDPLHRRPSGFEGRFSLRRQAGSRTSRFSSMVPSQKHIAVVLGTGRCQCGNAKPKGTSVRIRAGFADDLVAFR